ncbi:MAG: hypothetical protein QOI54_2644 [Actinomycetota bacterium]|jgi:hypothetical protein|nr:hypothetical protein [Actinomycetota bacterium]
MTDTTFVPGQIRMTEPNEPEESPGEGRRGLLILLGAAGVIVVAILAWFLLFSGGGQDATPVAAGAAPTAAPSQQAEAPTTAPTPAATAPVKDAKLQHAFRDPFKPLIAPAAVGGSATGGTTTGTSGSTATGTTGTTAGAATTGPAQPQASPSYRVQVTKVSADNKAIDIKVDGTLHKGLKAGQVFAKYFKVIGIGGSVNVIQFGDVKFTIAGTKAVTISS